MGILHDMLAKIHLAHENELALADPKTIQTQAHHGFLAETADLVHALEARIISLEHALFGGTEPAAPSVAPASTVGAEPSSTEPTAPAA